MTLLIYMPTHQLYVFSSFGSVHEIKKLISGVQNLPLFM